MPPALKQDLTPWQVINTFVEDFNNEVQDYPFSLHFVSVSKLLAHTGRPQEVFEKEFGQKNAKVAVFELVWDVDVTMENVTKVVKCIPGNLQSQGFLEVTGIISCGGCYYSSVCKVQDNWRFYDKFSDKDPVSWVKIAWFLISGNRYPTLLAYHRVEGYKSTPNFITSLDFENLLKFSRKQDSLIKQRSRNTERPQDQKLQDKPPLKPNTIRSDQDDPDQSRKSSTPLTRKYDFSEFKPEPKPSLSRDFKLNEDIKALYKKNDQFSPRNKEDSLKSWDKGEEMERIYLGTPKEVAPVRSFSRQEESFPKLNYTPQRHELREGGKFMHFSPKDGEKGLDYPSPYFREKNFKDLARDERFGAADQGYRERNFREAGREDRLGGEFDERGEGINREDLQGLEYKAAYRLSESSKKDQKFRPSFENFAKEDLGPRKDPDDSIQKQSRHFDSLLEKYKSDAPKNFQEKFESETQKPSQSYSRDFNYNDRWKSELGKRVLGQKQESDEENINLRGLEQEKFEKKEEKLNDFKGIRSRDEEYSRVDSKLGEFDWLRNRNEDARIPELAKFKLKETADEGRDRDNGSAGMRFKGEDMENERFKFRPEEKRDSGDRNLDFDRFRARVEENFEEKEGVDRFRAKNDGDLDRFRGKNEDFERFKPNSQEKYAEIDRFRGKTDEKYADIDRFRGKTDEKYAEIERFRGKAEEKYGEIDSFRGKTEERFGENERFRGKTEENFGEPDRFKFKPSDQYSELTTFKRKPEEKFDLDRFRPKPEEKFLDQDRFRSDFRTPDTFAHPSHQEDPQEHYKSKQDLRSELKAQDLSLKPDPQEKPSIRQFRSFDNSEIMNRHKQEYSEDQFKGNEVHSRLYRPDSPKELIKDSDSSNPQLFKENLGKYRQAENHKTEDSGLSEWNCSKCSKSVPGTSYECTECRLINWDQFYKVKSLQHSRNRPEESANKEGLSAKDEAVRRLYSFSDKKDEDAQDWTCSGCGTANKSLFFLCKGCRKPKTQSEPGKKEYRFSS